MFIYVCIIFSLYVLFVLDEVFAFFCVVQERRKKKMLKIGRKIKFPPPKNEVKKNMYS